MDDIINAKQIKELLLEKIKLQFKYDFVGNIDVKSYLMKDYEKFLIDEITTHVIMELMGLQKIAEVDFSYSTPKNWWQHFKLSHLKFIHKYFPVKYSDNIITKKINVKALFPELAPMNRQTIIYTTK